MTAASSKPGWRHSRCAASAPAKPVAPATITRGEPAKPAATGAPAARAWRCGSATQLTPQLAERRDDPLARGRDVLVGERALGRSGTTAPAPASACPRRPARRCRRRTRSRRRASPRRPRARRSSTSAAAIASGSDTARSWRSEGTDANGRKAAHRRGGGGELAEVDREHGGALEVPLRGDERVQLAEEAEPDVSDPSAPTASTAALRPGCRNGHAPRLHRPSRRGSLSSSASSSALAAKKSASRGLCRARSWTRAAARRSAARRARGARRRRRRRRRRRAR